jgi:putative flippase GtrA
LVKAPQFVLFVIAGGTAALVNIVARLLFNVVTSFETAVVLAFPLGLTTAFMLNRSLVFDASEGNATQQYARFFVVNIAGLAVIWVVSVLLVRILFPAVGFTWHAKLIGHTIGVLSPIVVSYYGHKHYSFRRQAAREP